MPRYRAAAVSIGVTYRPESPLGSLVCTAGDAQAVRGVLQGACGFDTVRVLVGPHATVSRLLATLEALRGPFDLFLLYFAGHGSTSDDGSHWVHFAHAGLLDYADSLDLRTLCDRARTVPARRRVLVVDACRNTRDRQPSAPQFGHGLVGDLQRLALPALPRGVTVRPTGNAPIDVLLACGANQVSWEDTAALRRGVFTHHLCQELERTRGGVSLADLHARVRERTVQWCRENGLTPEQRPELVSSSPGTPLRDGVAAGASAHAAEQQPPTVTRPGAMRVGKDFTYPFRSLAAAVAAAAPGAQVALARGRFREAVTIGRDLSIESPERSSTLESSAEPCVRVEGGRVHLAGLTLRQVAGRGRMIAALHVRGGVVRVDGCRLTSKSGPALHVAGPEVQLTARHASLEGGDRQSGAVLAADGASLRLEACSFAWAADPALMVEGHADVEIDGGRFEHLGGRAVVVRAGGSVRLRGVSFEPGRGAAVTVERGGHVQLDECTFDDRSGAAIVVRPGARADVRRCVFSGAAPPLQCDRDGAMAVWGVVWNDAPLAEQVLP